MMKNHGFTLLEIMFSVAILTIVMGILFGLALGIGDTAGAQQAKMNATEEARRGMQVLLRHLHNASRANLMAQTTIPGKKIVFQEPVESVATGKPVDINGNITLGPVRTVQVNPADPTQLIMTVGGAAGGANPIVLCNNMMPPDATGAAQPFQISQDPISAGLIVDIQTEGRDRRQRVYRTNLRQFFMPRNP